MAQQGQQVQQQAQQQQAAPQPAGQPAGQVATDKLRGSIPETFNDDRRRSQQFMHQFNLLWGLNEMHEIMTVPYFRAMYTLSLMCGPHINDWVNNQVTILTETSTCAQNPIPRADEQHWNNLKAAFESAYTDTAKEQTATQKLMALKMYKSDIDFYIATFENLVREAGYNRDAKGTVHLFAQGLRPDLLNTLLYLPVIPETMDEWQEKACNEIKKNAYCKTLLPSSKCHYKWQFQHSNGNGRHHPRHHPNDETVLMDVDVPIFTQVNRVYTSEDKKQHHLYGKCFNCSKQGHMAKDCPLKKK